MGNSHCTDNLYRKIRDDIHKLLIDYQFWADDDICDKLEIIYFDKLIKFRKSNLLDVSTAIGYKYDSTIDKQLICKSIIEHYRRRIKLFQKIYDIIEIGRERVNRAHTGPVCRNVNTYVDNFIACEKIPNSLWVNEDEYKNIIKEFKKHNLYEGWNVWIDKLNKTYKKILYKLFNIVNKIKNDIDNSMSDETFTILENYTYDLIKNYDTLSEIYYLLAINYG